MDVLVTVTRTYQHRAQAEVRLRAEDIDSAARKMADTSAYGIAKLPEALRTPAGYEVTPVSISIANLRRVAPGEAHLGDDDLYSATVARTWRCDVVTTFDPHDLGGRPLAVLLSDVLAALELGHAFTGRPAVGHLVGITATISEA